MELRDYQISIANAASELLNKYKIAYLSMQVRTGKTLTALEAAHLYKAKSVLFCTKKGAISSIEKDYQENYSDKFRLFVTNFEQLHNLTDRYDLIIIDEAHSLGQYPKYSLRTVQLKDICKNRPIIYLSGTPSPESYSQLYHQFYVSSYSPFDEYTFYKWAHKYVTIEAKYLYNRQINDYSKANKELIDDKVKHLFISFTQEEAGFEQLVEEKIHKIQMSERTYVNCKRLSNDRILRRADGNIIEADSEVKLMNKLHQMYSGTVLLDVDKYGNKLTENNMTIVDTSKIDYIINNFQNKKIAIYYKFRTERILIESEMIKKGYKIAESPEEFNNTDINCIFLSQFVSGREGINLSSADCLVCYNIDFSAVTYFQVRARLQYKDREKAAIVHWIFAENGIEEKIYQVVKSKKNYTLSYFKNERIGYTKTDN